MTKILKSPDPEYKLRVAEKYFVDKKYNKAQILYEDVMPYYKTRPEFQDIYYKYAYCAYNQMDYPERGEPVQDIPGDLPLTAQRQRKWPICALTATITVAQG